MGLRGGIVDLTLTAAGDMVEDASLTGGFTVALVESGA
jgi:hypothetical protein